MVPLPGLETVTALADDLLKATNSASVFAFTDGLTAITTGISPTNAIGVRSFSASKGMGW